MSAVCDLLFFFSSRRRHTRCALVTGVQTCALPILTGSESHAGTTPMNRRRDALVAAAKLVQAVNGIALAHPPHAVSTVGMMQVSPNSRNTIQIGRASCRERVSQYV